MTYLVAGLLLFSRRALDRHRRARVAGRHGREARRCAVESDLRPGLGHRLRDARARVWPRARGADGALHAAGVDAPPGRVAHAAGVSAAAGDVPARPHQGRREASDADGDQGLGAGAPARQRQSRGRAAVRRLPRVGRGGPHRGRQARRAAQAHGHGSTVANERRARDRRRPRRCMPCSSSGRTSASSACRRCCRTDRHARQRPSPCDSRPCHCSYWHCLRSAPLTRLRPPWKSGSQPPSIDAPTQRSNCWPRR